MSGRRSIRVEGARQNNLKGVTVTVPVGAVPAVTGVAVRARAQLRGSTVKSQLRVARLPARSTAL